MQKAILNNGLCVQYIKGDYVLANCYYEDFNTITETLKVLMDLINGYNLNLASSNEDDELIAVRFFENKNNVANSNYNIRAKLMKDSLEDLIEMYDEEVFAGYGDGRIGFNDSDKEENETKARIIVQLIVDERKIYIEDYELNKKFKEQFEDENPDIDVDDLDLFEYDFSEFNFYDLEDIIEFMEEHSSKSEKEKACFRIATDDKFLYSFT